MDIHNLDLSQLSADEFRALFEKMQAQQAAPVGVGMGFAYAAPESSTPDEEPKKQAPDYTPEQREYLRKKAELEQDFEEVSAAEFYRDIFKPGALERAEHQEDQKPNGIISIINKDYSYNRMFFDDLEEIERVNSEAAFAILAPISYDGKNRTSKNARWLHALTFDLDGVGKQQMHDLFFQMQNKILPYPNYVCNSGHGLHLYYVFEEPIALYKKNREELKAWKYALTDKLWNLYTSTIKPADRQYQGIYQGFRIVGSSSKLGANYPVTAYRVTDTPCSVEQLNGFLLAENQFKGAHYQGDASNFEVACKKYPEWAKSQRAANEKLGAEVFEKTKTERPDIYEQLAAQNDKGGAWVLDALKRIDSDYRGKIIAQAIKNKPKGKYWHVKRDLYDWWKKKIESGAAVGHRYHCLSILAAFAQKCDIDEEEFLADAAYFAKAFEELTDSENNHFTDADRRAACEMYYNDEYNKYTRATAEKLSAIPMPANRRNGRKQAQHLTIARYIRDMEHPDGAWREGNGRPDIYKKIQAWKAANPNGNKSQCARELNCSRTSVQKWWDITPEQYKKM